MLVRNWRPAIINSKYCGTQYTYYSYNSFNHSNLRFKITGRANCSNCFKNVLLTISSN